MYKDIRTICNRLRIVVFYFLGLVAAPIYLLLAFMVAVYVRYFCKFSGKPRIVWGPVPIINNHYWSMVMRNAGHKSETFTFDYYSRINRRENWDRLLTEEYGCLPKLVKLGIAFLDSLYHYDVFVIPFSGYFLGGTPIWFVEAPLFKIAKKKTLVIPYGADAFVYRNIASPLLAHGLMLSYPQAAKRQDTIERSVKYWVRYANVISTGWMSPDGVGRWDVLPVSPLCVDLAQWKKSSKVEGGDGVNGTVYIAHAPNHRGFKGTEFIIEAINSLQSEGLKVELILLENVQNEDVRRMLESEVDILVDQLVFTGYSLNTIEGMASGLPTICNLEDPTYTTMMRRWSYLGECPIVSTTLEDIKGTLRKLIKNPVLRKDIGDAGRRYVEKYHSFDAADFLFSNIIDYMYGKRGSLMNLYHPLMGEYRRDEARIVPPFLKD